MSICANYNKFAGYLEVISQGVEIERNKEKDLRYNVWETLPQYVSDLFSVGVEALPWNKNNSRHIKTKIENSLLRIAESSASAKSFTKDIMDSDNNIELSIALHEVMESVKGEADKARNLSLEVSKISGKGLLPALPMSRVAASIGRKIAFQMGYRFKKTKVNKKEAAEIEALYYAIGKKSLEDLQKKGYVSIDNKHSTIKDYIDVADLKKKSPSTNEIVEGVLSVKLNEDKIGIGFVKVNKEMVPNEQTKYFLKRTDSNLDNTELGVMTDMLRAVRQITQPAQVEMPDKAPTKTLEELRGRDDKNIYIDPETEKVRQKIYENPVYINTGIHGLLSLLSAEVAKTGSSASRILRNKISDATMSSLFGIKVSSDYSVDKKESVSGQNLSKTATLDDLVDYYDVIQDGKSEPAALHMMMKIGRNARLYYENSILNPHGSKQSRYMLTSGKYTVDSGSAEYNYLVYGIGQALNKDLTYDEIVGNDSNAQLEKALEDLALYSSNTTLQTKLASLSRMSLQFKGVDYVTLITSLQAISDVRNPVNGKVETEFQVSADATASGGTLTFLQALGTNPNVEEFLQRIGLLKSKDGSIRITLDDIYGLMTEAISKFNNGEIIPTLIDQETDSTPGKVRSLLIDTVELLFNKGSEARELSKDPTMTFIYGQKGKGASETMAGALADRIVDNLDNKNVRKYLGRLFNDTAYESLDSKNLKDMDGLYKEIKRELEDSGLTDQLYSLMDASINEEYLSEFKARSAKVNNLVKQLGDKASKFKILPAAAKMSGIEPILSMLKKYGMPLTKIFEVSNPVPNTDDTVLTRVQKLTETVANVSTIHGIDAAQIYGALAKVMGKNGVTVIHDDIRGTVQDVMAMEAAYREVTKAIVSEYDVHEATMKALAAYSPEIAATAEYKTLMAEIESDRADKSKIINEAFNNETDALIGDGKAYIEFAKESKSGPPSGPAKAVSKITNKVTPKKKIITKDKVSNLVSKIASESPLLTKFLELSGVVDVDPKAEIGDNYSTITDKVTITGKDGRDLDKLLDLSNKSDLASQVEIVEHEVTHAFTIAMLNKEFLGESTTSETNNLKFILKATNSIIDMLEKGKLNSLSEKAIARIEYIKAQENNIGQVAEFLSIMTGETDTANEIYQALSGRLPESKLRKLIKDFIKTVQEYIVNFTQEDFDNSDIDPDKLQYAILGTLTAGISLRENKADEFARYLAASKKTQNVYGTNSKAPREAGLNYLNYAVASMLNSKVEREGKRLSLKIHKAMKKNFPIYSDVVDKINGIYDGSEALQQVIHTITGNGVDKTKKADILAQFAAVMASQTAVINDQMGKFNNLLAPLSKAEKATIGRFITETPLHDYFVLANKLVTEDAIASEVVRLETKLRANGKKSAIKEVNDLVEWNVLGNENTKGKFYNLDAGDTSSNDSLNEDVLKLFALKSIQAIGAKDFEKFLENTELVNLIKDNSVANKLSLTDNEGESKLKDSLIMDYYKEPIVIEAIELKDLKRYENGENTGWKVLELPTESKLGIVYKPTIDSSSIMGAYTDIKLNSTDTTVSDKLRKYPGVVKTVDGYKLRISKENKIKMGLVEDFSQGLVRSAAHNMAIQDSQIIRDELLKAESIMIIGNESKELNDIIESDNIDNPWFLKLEEGVSYLELDKSVRAKYQVVGNRASNVKGFNKNVDLVRKDISHWLLGGSASSLFQNPQMKWAIRITKDLIAGAKIGMVVLNPMKIASDNISNISYLGVMGVSPLFVAKNYKDITRDFQSYSDIQRKIIQLKVKLVASPKSTKLSNKLQTLQKDLARNPLGDIGDKGFINSLGSDLVAKNADTLSGLQADMHNALEYLLINKKGNKNYVANFIVQLQNLGFNGEDFLSYVGGIVKRSGSSGKGFKKELDQVAERLKEIRTEEDVINYVSQYTTSPGSEAVRIGASVTDLTDVLAKETYYRHLVENSKLTSEEARIEVLDSFPDYKENMPLAVKQLSDMGIIMFPSFWLRIQKVIYRMVRDKPINLSTELMLEEAFNSNVNTILDANIINKSNTFGGLLHTPFESIGVGSIIPMHLL